MPFLAERQTAPTMAFGRIRVLPRCTLGPGANLGCGHDEGWAQVTIPIWPTGRKRALYSQPKIHRRSTKAPVLEELDEGRQQQQLQRATHGSGPLDRARAGGVARK